MPIYRSSRPFSAKVRFLRRLKKGGKVNYEISEQLEREKDRVSEATREKRNWLRRSPLGEKTAEVVDREIKKKKGEKKKEKKEGEREPRSAFRHLYPRDFSPPHLCATSTPLITVYPRLCENAKLQK